MLPGRRWGHSGAEPRQNHQGRSEKQELGAVSIKFPGAGPITMPTDRENPVQSSIQETNMLRRVALFFFLTLLLPILSAIAMAWAR